MANMIKNKQIADAFEDKEDRLKTLTHFSFEGIIFYQNGTALFINEAVLKVTGYTREEIAENNIVERIIPDKNHRVLFMKSTTTSRAPFEIEMLRKDGRPITVEIESQKVVYNKEVINVVSIRDISSRRRIEDEINKFTVAVDQSANIVIITKINGEIEYVNHSFTKVTGYKPDEVIGQNPRILKSGKQSTQFYQNLWQTLKKGKQWTGEFQNRKKNGEIYWEYATITPVRNKDGEIIRYIAIKEDITNQKKAEQSLRESEEQYRSMVSNIPGALYRCALDQNRTMYYITDAIETLSGYKAEGFLFNKAKSYANIIHQEDLEKVLQTIQSELSENKQYTVEYRIITSDNTVKWVSDNGRPVYDENHQVKWLDGFIFDISERISVLEELTKAKQFAEEASRAKSEFLANISHEIRTPLNTVLGFTELMENMTLDETQLKYLNSIKSSGKNLMTLINDLLDLSKIEAGRVNLKYTSVKVKNVLDEIRNVFSYRAEKKGIEYNELIDRDFPEEIVFDETRLRQILINLVGNAIKFTNEGHVDLVICSRSRDMQNGKAVMKMEIMIVDTGIGIPEESFKSIFDSFRQQLQLDSRKYEGTGLGLSITKRLVEAMNGKIILKSEVGKGTTFKVIFPCVEYVQQPVTQPKDKTVRKKYGKHLLSAMVNIGNNSSKAGIDDRKVFGAMKHDKYKLVLDKLENTLYPQWKQFESKKPLKEIKSFAQEIIKLGKKNKAKYIKEYGEQLYLTIENFDIEEMQLKLEEFPNLLFKLKNISYES